MTRTRPYSGTDLASFITHRITELRGRKSQAQIASAAGYNNPNNISMLKSGAAKLALDRVPDLARALDVDPARLFRLALLQSGNETAKAAIDEIFGAIVTRNEAGWLDAIRDASDESDPALTSRTRATIRGIFNK